MKEVSGHIFHDFYAVKQASGHPFHDTGHLFHESGHVFHGHSNRTPISRTQFSCYTGWDLTTSCHHFITSGSRILVNTGQRINLPKGTFAPRSSLSLKGIDIGGGIIDPDYSGEQGRIVAPQTP